MRRICAVFFCLSACLAVALADSTKVPGPWATWRGPGMQGHCDDPRVPLTWSEKENVLWKTPLPGSGNSTPIIVGNRVFLTAAKDNGATRLVLCLAADTGKVLWEKVAAKEVAQEKSHAWNGWASPSCACDGERVYAFFGTPGLFCYDVEGNFKWKREFGIFTSSAGWGTAASPFLYENTVILNCDNDGGKDAAPAVLLAMDKVTGKDVWSTPRNQGRGFSTPRLMKTTGNRVDLILNGPDGLWGYDPATGKEIWQCRRTSTDDKHKFGEPIPVDDGKRIFVLSGRTGPMQILTMPNKGDVTESNVKHTTIRSKNRDVSSPILKDGLVYQVCSKGNMSCYELDTGKEVFTADVGARGKLKSLGSPIALRGKLLWIMDEGTTLVVHPGRKFDLAHKNKLDGTSLDFGASPAVADGRLYLRSQQFLYCIGEKK
jgi:hypothetical protein